MDASVDDLSSYDAELRSDFAATIGTAESSIVEAEFTDADGQTQIDFVALSDEPLETDAILPDDYLTQLSRRFEVNIILDLGNST